MSLTSIVLTLALNAEQTSLPREQTRVQPIQYFLHEERIRYAKKKESDYQPKLKPKFGRAGGYSFH